MWKNKDVIGALFWLAAMYLLTLTLVYSGDTGMGTASEAAAHAVESLTGLVSSLMISPAVQYFGGAAFFYLLFWVLFKRKWMVRKVQDAYPKTMDYVRELVHSSINLVALGILTVWINAVAGSGYSRMYFEIEEYGWAYWGLSIVIAFFALDTYYYWVHRLLHAKYLFRYAHRIHHLSRTPSPWTTFSISPLEQSIVGVFFMLLIVFVPMHPTALMVFSLVGLARQFVGHLGIEVFPKKTLDGALRWSLTVTHHDMHHEFVNCNYGLYFSWWDKWMDTNHEEYEARFRQVVSRKYGEQRNDSFEPAR